ncbi:WXG100 family type VII secretion target [Streptomyces sp. NPDC127098]|uniref:WXG100 family type VII secretion target n=1 Tax=Streptomyces sp. NPDC127098 TaxID=3347137 RepID=UPI0036646D64
MVNLSVNYGSLTTGSEGLNQQERALLEKIETLHAELLAVGGGWEGEAQRAFQANMAVFTQELEHLARILGRTGNQLSESAYAYAEADRRGAAQAEGMRP